MDEVTTGIGDKWTKAKAKADAGKVNDGVGGYGFVAVMKNGDGPTLWMRADMDALPLEEKTTACLTPARSSAQTIKARPRRLCTPAPAVGGSHMAIMVGTARRLAAMKDQWSGTLVLLGQPAEKWAWRAGDAARQCL
ncbi:MAG: hypothetical protein R3C40_03185 [Parvularculaceae bacterium]